jgi:hypothetical protein
MSFRRILPILLLSAVPAVASAQAATQTGAPAPRPKPAQLPADSMERARKFTQWFYNNQHDSLLVQVDSANKAQARQQLTQNLVQLSERAGTEVKVIEEKFITRNGARQYWRTAQFSTLDEPILLRWVMGPKGEYNGMGLGLLRQAPPIDP